MFDNNDHVCIAEYTQDKSGADPGFFERGV